MGEQPCLWSSLKLKLEFASIYARRQSNARRLQVLQGVLNMRRLRTLQQLSVDFSNSFWTHLSWEDVIHFLQILPPTIQKLSLEGLDPVSRPPIHMLAEELVAKLVKFEEVYFDCYSLLENWDISRAILRRLTAVISSGEDSKLKVLSFPGLLYQDESFIETLQEARKVLPFKILHSSLLPRGTRPRNQ